MVASQDPSPGWHPDPFGRFARRYWDGDAWTAHVTDAAGVAKTDPPSHGSHVSSSAATDDDTFARKALSKGLVLRESDAWILDFRQGRWVRYDGVGLVLPGAAAGQPGPGPTRPTVDDLERVRAATTREEIERLLAGPA